MLAFRSEAHVDVWCETRKRPRGAVAGMEQCWVLAQAWFPEIVAHGWLHSNPRRNMQSVFAHAGLAGPFWSVA